MRAIGYRDTGTIDRPDALVEFDRPDPVPTGRELLVEVKAVSVNPVDVKVRGGMVLRQDGERVIGWDASGIVRGVGPDVSLFRIGDAVAYAGEIGRSGTNAELHIVDERLVGPKPASLDWAEAAALPLTSVTAWEVLFDRLDVNRPVVGAAPAIVIIGGAGGVGSIAIQLARQLTDLTVIATASRPETRAWAMEMGAHHVFDHVRPLPPQVEALGIGAPAFVFSTTHSDRHRLAIAELIAPEGRFGLIDDPEVFDIVPFKAKSVSIHWELMFTRSLPPAADMGRQGQILGEIARMVDDGRIRSTLTERLSPIGVATLAHAHRKVDSGTMRGKIALEGWA
jgi:zinc-binding alcohol dehydrogenase family protein